MFKIGDYVTHYKEGVCEVIDIGKLDMRCSDRKKEYYTLKPLYDTGGTLYMPVANERNQIRGVITHDEAQALIEDIPNIEALWVTDEKKRESLYKEAVFKNQCKEWIAIIKTSYLRKMDRLSSGKKSINVDDKYLSIAEPFLAWAELPRLPKYLREKVRGCISQKRSSGKTGGTEEKKASPRVLCGGVYHQCSGAEETESWKSKK
ncbi:MAG: CarD family transcriptional regulator [[Clostridium] scindens]